MVTTHSLKSPDSSAQGHAVAIVGGAGYLGRALQAHHVQNHFNSWVVGRRRSTGWLLTDPGRYRCSEPCLDDAVAGASTVVHLASLTTPATGERSPALEADNLRMTIAVAEACVKNRVRHLIFASSGGTIYGELDEPATENHPARPECSYGAGKLASEHCLYVYSRRSNLPVTVLRLSNVYGGGQVSRNGQGVIAYLAGQISSGQPVRLFGNTVRDYVYIDDVVTAFDCAMRHFGGFQVVNISTGVGTHLVELARLLYAMRGEKERISLEDLRPFDLRYNVLNNDKARELLGWAPRYDLRGGLEADWSRDPASVAVVAGR